MTWDQVFASIGVTAVMAPTLLVLAFGVTAMLSRPLSERASARLTAICVSVGLIASVIVLAMMLSTGNRHVEIEWGDWVAVHSRHADDSYHFHLKFVFDRLSVPFTLLIFVLVGTIGAFANRYLHREPGYNRFFTFYALFLLGMVVAALAGTVETLFLGWELVGLSSALLVAYFHNRPAPVRNGQRVWAIYRFADAAFLVAAVALHQVHGDGDFATLMGDGPWPYGQVAVSGWSALAIGSMLLIAAAGKSALIPFSGWLPRAMEGPTPSSAVFYGALSVHLGTYLLLRVSPLLQLSPLLCGAIVVLGLSSAVFGAMTARVQTDVKSALAFASLSQVGLITAEIGFGFYYLALIHMVGHATLRTLQLIRTPSLLQDHHSMENAIGEHIDHTSGGNPDPSPRIRRLYRFTMMRGGFDPWLDAYVVAPFLGFFRACNALESRCTRFLQGADQATPPRPEPQAVPPKEAA